ncbi:hypothetical protein [Candidatus Villigracilis saccharophilus]|uniref:hypothetical protein n=1 Tax=Candidatus Villigracilis saccharophilus TaxID=3140684 RepID=UPI0031368806|nr:hypothetical protein [Anaerolineales bacterium]
MTASSEMWISLLIQVPLVGIFVWFSLQLISYFLKSIDTRDAAWREYMTQQREANNQAIKHMAERFSDEIRTLGKEVAALKGQIEK